MEFQILIRPHSHASVRRGLRLACAAVGLSLMASQANGQSTPQPPATIAEVPVERASPADLVFSGKRSADVFAAQVMLDRARFSPGVIDGLGGGNTSRAASDYQRSNGLVATGRVDAALLANLRNGDQEPVLMRYTLSEADLAGPFRAMPAGMEAMAELDGTYFETAGEALAEKFHMSLEFLRALNPGIDSATAGTIVSVAAARPAPIGAIVVRIEIDSAASALRAYAADGRLLASYPATVGSADFPSPSGSMAVRVVAPRPAYYFSPEGRTWGPNRRLTIAPGPNNPVGSTWIDLTKEGYGIHGTPDPSLIGKTSSHGCVRLTNWDAQELARAVEPGTEIVFR